MSNRAQSCSITRPSQLPLVRAHERIVDACAASTILTARGRRAQILRGEIRRDERRNRRRARRTPARATRPSARPPHTSPSRERAGATTNGTIEVRIEHDRRAEEQRFVDIEERRQQRDAADSCASAARARSPTDRPAATSRRHRREKRTRNSDTTTMCGSGAWCANAACSASASSDRRA